MNRWLCTFVIADMNIGHNVWDMQYANFAGQLLDSLKNKCYRTFIIAYINIGHNLWDMQ